MNKNSSAYMYINSTTIMVIQKYPVVLLLIDSQ